VAPTSEFVYRPLAVAEPFDRGRVLRYPVDRIVADHGATFVRDELSWVATRAQCAFLASGEELEYDALVLALGSDPRPAWPHVPTFRGPRDVGMVRELVGDVERGSVRSIGYLVPPGNTWPFPLYELALQTARSAQKAGAEVELVLFSPEREPLEVFGSEASAAVADVMAAMGVEFRGGAEVSVEGDQEVLIRGATERLGFDRLLALPRLEGPAPRGIPCDDDGFIPIDSHGMVLHVEHVYAVGDGTNFPVKQGGIATQQADAVAEMIAKRAGARVDPRPFRPILRGHLLADGSSRFLRAELHARDGGTSEASETPMWWPAGKIAGTYLAPYLAELDSAGVEQRPCP
jgi:sulfide:quinone oxidoreductase